MPRYGTRSKANLKGTNQHLNAEEAIEAIAKAAATLTAKDKDSVKKAPATLHKVSKLHVAAQSSNDASATPRVPPEPSKQSPTKPAASPVPSEAVPEDTAPSGSSEPSITPSVSPQPPAQTSSNPVGYHLNLSDPKEYDLFLNGIRQKYDIISKISSLEIHLNASKHTEALDDRLAMALRFFSPNCDGTNDHNLRYIKLVFQGNVLFQRFNYSLVSPATSSEITNDLHKLLKEKNGLGMQAKQDLAYKIHATETSVSKALLAIRGVPKIVIEARAPAQVELGYAKLLRGVTSLPPTTPQQQVEQVFKKYEAGLSRPGEFWSGSYVEKEPKAVYPTKAYVDEPAPLALKKKVLVDQKTVLLGHFLGRDEQDIKKDAIAAAKTSDRKARGVKRKRFDEDKPVASVAKRQKITATGAKKGKGKAKGTTKKESKGDGVAMHDMARILVQKQKKEDLGAHTGEKTPFYINQKTQGAQTDDGTWMVLTGRGNAVQFGFKTR
jgi:hypothetical protein